MVHNVAPVRFIRAALPRMLERDKGDIINVSSLGAYLNMVTLELRHEVAYIFVAPE
jgi:short-subunit dehydrogenase